MTHILRLGVKYGKQLLYSSTSTWLKKGLYSSRYKVTIWDVGEGGRGWVGGEREEMF
jgi:hypothetical protein